MTQLAVNRMVASQFIFFFMGDGVQLAAPTTKDLSILQISHVLRALSHILRATIPYSSGTIRWSSCTLSHILRNNYRIPIVYLLVFRSSIWLEVAVPILRVNWIEISVYFRTSSGDYLNQSCFASVNAVSATYIPWILSRAQSVVNDPGPASKPTIQVSAPRGFPTWLVRII